ncbi:argininosuccinate lyase [Gammaproteobacteria bacterium]|nr:argininosuccinate lyase [Gammaproteobacteria bacterium]
MSKQIKKPWQGRFTETTNEFVEEFTASITFDQTLAIYDIRCSLAHTEMLASESIILKSEAESIITGLKSIEKDIEQENLSWSLELEDIHMNIENELIKRVGEVGKKLHTGRSRNDQVATDLRLYLRDITDQITCELRSLQKALLKLAENETATIFPGFTHLQVAQPVSFAHHIMAWFEMIDRDIDRFSDYRKRMNVLPLGSAALAGTSYPINRDQVASILGFEKVAKNSMDAVSDRDFAIEFCSNSSLLMMHFSRWAEELILWSTPQYDFISLPDSFCTGSSIMPQKKNPDVPELIRGKTGRVYGALFNLLTLMKAQPLAYNKDNQEDKEPVFDTAVTIRNCLKAFILLIPEISLNREKMATAATQGFSTATDLADYLAKKGMAFRDSHETVGEIVQHAIQSNCSLFEIDLKVYQSFSKLIDKDIYEILSLEGSLNSRNSYGGTSPNNIELAIQEAKQRLIDESLKQKNSG